MKISKDYIGKYVEIIWRDPGEARFEIPDYGDAPTGRGCLATWQERGVVIDVADGVVKIEHSHVGAAPLLKQKSEAVCSFVPEVLIESIDIFVRQIVSAEPTP